MRWKTQTYWDKVALVERLNPAEILLKSIKKEHTIVTEAFLAAAWARIPDCGVVSPDLGEETDHVETETLADDTTRELWRRRSELFGQMNKLSNTFHGAKTDEERARISKAILAIWDRICEVKATLATYQSTGELPTYADSDELPDNPVALSKKLNSIRAQISQRKKQLVSLAGLDEGTMDKQLKIDAAEESLKRLKLMAGLAEQKLATYGEE